MPPTAVRIRGAGGGGRNREFKDWIEFTQDQARSKIEYPDGTISTKCDQCRATYGERTPPEDPPCSTCWVDLMPENAAAAEVYMISQNQIITAGMGQIIDMSIPAVKIVMDLWQVSNQKRCLSKVLAAFHHLRCKDEPGQNGKGLT